MKKAFTLVEIIAAIVLLGVISLIVIPVVNSSIKDNKEKLYKEQLNRIEINAEKWAYNNLDALPTPEKPVTTITVLQLKQAGLLPVDLKNPKTDQDIPNDMNIEIVLYNNNYEYHVLPDTGTVDTGDINKDAPLIALYGSVLEYIEINGEYIEQGAIAKDVDGTVLENIVITYKENDKQISGIDTKYFKTYTATYSVTSNKNGINHTSSIIRTIIIRDTTPPELVIPDNVEINETDIANFSIMTGVSATDNSLGEVTISVSGYNIIPGEKTVTYTATDQSGNSVSKKRKVTITSTPIEIVISPLNNPINSNGWAKANFYVQIRIINKGLVNISGYKWCLGSGECTPTTEVNDVKGNALISTEGNNVVCVLATNIQNKTESKCSSIYKLDKTVPVIGNIVTSGTVGSNGWFTSNVVVSKTNSSDTLSGIASDTLSPVAGTITSDTTGINYTLTATDKAGNTSTKSLAVKKDSTTPTTPVITGGRTTHALTQTISLSTASTDATSGLQHYEYYITTSSSAPASNVTATGTTSGNKIFDTDYNGEYVYYRAVDRAGNKSNWSNGQRLYVQAFNGSFNIAISAYNTVKIQSATATTSYNLKYASGNQTASYMYSNGTSLGSNATEGTFTASSNGIYTIALVGDSASKVILKKVYVYNFGNSTTQNQSTTVTVSGISSIVGNAFTHTGSATASLSGTSLALTASSGSYWTYDFTPTSCASYSCSSGSLSGTSCLSTYTVPGHNKWICLGNAWAYNGSSNNGCPNGGDRVDTWCAPAIDGQYCTTNNTPTTTPCTGTCQITTSANCSSWYGYYTYYYRYTVGVIVN